MLCQVATFEARLWFGLDQAREAFLEEEPAAPELARMEGGTGVGYVYVHADPAAELAESLSELTLVASSSFSELFHQSGAFRGCLTALLESVGARAELLDLEGNLHPVFWLDGQTFRACRCASALRKPSGSPRDRRPRSPRVVVHVHPTSGSQDGSNARSGGNSTVARQRPPDAQPHQPKRTHAAGPTRRSLSPPGPAGLQR